MIVNTQATLLVFYSVLQEASFLASCHLCKSALCTGVAFNKDTTTCTVNKYGRIILEVDSASSVWIKRTDKAYAFNYRYIEAFLLFLHFFQSFAVAPAL